MPQEFTNSRVKVCPRFGQLAVKMGYLSPGQLKEGLNEQVDDNLAGRPHRNLGVIFVDRGWLTPGQMDEVLNEMFRLLRQFEQQGDYYPDQPG